MKNIEGLTKTKMPWGEKGKVKFNAVELDNWQNPEMSVEDAHELIRQKENWRAGETALRLQALQVVANHNSDQLGLERVPVKASNSLILSAALIMGYANEKQRDFIGVNKHFLNFRKTMADTVVHERRHNYQHAVLDGEIEHDLPEKEVQRLRENHGIYNGKPREVDARNHARSYMKEHKLGASLVTATNDLLSPVTTIKRAVKEAKESR